MVPVPPHVKPWNGRCLLESCLSVTVTVTVQTPESFLYVENNLKQWLIQLRLIWKGSIFFSTLLKYSIEAIVTQVPGIRDRGSPREVDGIGLCFPDLYLDNF